MHLHSWKESVFVYLVGSLVQYVSILPSSYLRPTMRSLPLVVVSKTRNLFHEDITTTLQLALPRDIEMNYVLL